MTRDVLAFLLCALTLATGLATAAVQSENRAEALRLDGVQSECRMIEAMLSACHADLVALDWGPDAGAQDGRNAPRSTRAPGSVPAPEEEGAP